MKIFFTALWLCLISLGAAANDFTLTAPTLDGKNFDLSAQKNRVTIVNFWAYWCTECRREMLVLEEIYQKYHGQGVDIIGVSIDKKSARKKVLSAAIGVSYPNALFDEASKISFQEPSSIPVTYIFDRNLTLVTKFDEDDGTPNKNDFERVLEPLLKK
jgi:thiol-disulfide isomerase/thioredoxin